MYSFLFKEANFVSFTLHLKTQEEKEKTCATYWSIEIFHPSPVYRLPLLRFAANFCWNEKEEPRHRPCFRSLPLHVHLSGSSLSSKCLCPPRNLILSAFVLRACRIQRPVDFEREYMETAIILLHIYRFILWDTSFEKIFEDNCLNW